MDVAIKTRRAECYPCRALLEKHGFLPCSCFLGYSIRRERKNSHGWEMDIPYPDEPCPRPLTRKAFMRCDSKG